MQCVEVVIVSVWVVINVVRKVVIKLINRLAKDLLK